MTHLLPPNLLKLFAPRPPLPYTRPVGKDPDRVRSKNVGGIASILVEIREDNTAGLIIKGQKEDEEGEEGEEKTFTHAEETLREIRREERKKQKEEQFKKAKDSCKYMMTVR
jgi:U1 small nuclear ribonucleoprotein 70kDa